MLNKCAEKCPDVDDTVSSFVRWPLEAAASHVTQPLILATVDSACSVGAWSQVLKTNRRIMSLPTAYTLDLATSRPYDTIAQVFFSVQC